MATALDKRPPSAESQYDPETVRLMKQLGVWHPALALSPGSEKRPNPEYTHEQRVTEQIAQMRAHQDAQNENRRFTSQARSDAQAEAERGRNERAGALRELKTTQESDKRNQGLVQALGQMVPGSPEHKAIMDQYLKSVGVVLPTAPVDPKTAALQAFKDKKAGVVPTATAKTSMSPSALVALEAPGTRQPFIGGDIGGGQQGNVAADFVAGGKYSTAPVGSDKSLNQGFVDKLPFRTPLAQGDVNYQEKPPQATASTSFSPSALTTAPTAVAPQPTAPSIGAPINAPGAPYGPKPPGEDILSLVGKLLTHPAVQANQGGPVPNEWATSLVRNEEEKRKPVAAQ